MLIFPKGYNPSPKRWIFYKDNSMLIHYIQYIIKFENLTILDNQFIITSFTLKLKYL